MVKEKLTEQGIHSISTQGSAVNIDQALSNYKTNDEEIVKRLAKDYVDWYMLTKV